MKLKIKQGQTIATESGRILTEAIGRLENLTYAHLDGIIADPENIKMQIRLKVVFYAEPTLTGTLTKCFEIGVSLDDLEALGLLTQPANGQLTFNVIENAAYNYILTLDKYKDILELVN